jgi:hypothetical protein
MTERCLSVRSSFVKVGNKRRPAVLFIALIFVLLLLSSCNRSGPQDPVSESRINDTPENVARVYSEAVFTGNYLLMFKCYPRDFIQTMKEEDLAKTASWGTKISDSLMFSEIEFHGTDATSEEWESDEQSLPYRTAIEGISDKFNVEPDLITKISMCEVKLFFERAGEDKFQTVSVLVYQYDDQWYVYRMESQSD